MNPLKPSPELVAQWWKEAMRLHPVETGGAILWHSYIATKAASWGAQQRGVVVLSIELAEKLMIADSSEWAPEWDQLQAAIAAAKEKPCGCNTDWSDPNRPLITVCAKHMGTKENGE